MKDTENQAFAGDETVKQDTQDVEFAAKDAPVDAAPSGEEGEQSQAPQATELQSQVTELENRLMRVYADLENLRRRTRLEKEELSLYANAKLITDLLPVVDNLALALQATAGKEDSELVKGVDMVFKQFIGVLEKAGVKTIDPVGEAFDPNRHEAVMAEPIEDQEPGMVVQTFRTGYQLSDRVLRPAMVKVSG